MRKSLKTGLGLLSLLVPASVLAADMMTDNQVTPLSPIFVENVDPVWLNAHSAMQQWKSNWVGKQGTPEYDAAERAFVSKLEQQHRLRYHPVTFEVEEPVMAPIHVDSTPSVPSSLLRGTGRASLFLIKPKQSARTIRENVLLQRSKN